MTGGKRAKVVPLRAEPPAAPDPGFLGMTWAVTYDTRLRRWYFDGTPPGRSHWTMRLKVEHMPSSVTRADLEAGARIWSDTPEGAASLMAADIEQAATDDRVDEHGHRYDTTTIDGSPS